MIPLLTPRERQVYEAVIAQVSDCLGFAASDIEGPARTPKLVAARRVAIRLLRERGLTFVAIGKALGNRHHSSVKFLAESDDAAGLVKIYMTKIVDVEPATGIDEDNETPREARARVARELAAGLRCPACHLLRPCDHEQMRAA